MGDAGDGLDASGTAVRQAALLCTTFEIMQEGVMAVDGDCNVIAFNRRFGMLLGFAANEIRSGDPIEKYVRAIAFRRAADSAAFEELVREDMALIRSFEPHLREIELADG